MKYFMVRIKDSALINAAALDRPNLTPPTNPTTAQPKLRIEIEKRSD